MMPATSIFSDGAMFLDAHSVPRISFSFIQVSGNIEPGKLAVTLTSCAEISRVRFAEIVDEVERDSVHTMIIQKHCYMPKNMCCHHNMYEPTTDLRPEHSY